MEELENESVPAPWGRIPMTSVVNKVGYLEDYTERILPANLYQEFFTFQKETELFGSWKRFFLYKPHWYYHASKALKNPL